MSEPLTDSLPDRPVLGSRGQGGVGLESWLGRPEVRVLANGLTVALLTSEAAPVVSTALWYRAGTAHEPVEQEGVAHFLEHMMFKGSGRFATGEVDRLTQAAGGSNNAYTSHDATVYVFAFPAGRWRTALEIEADRMAGPTLDPAEVTAEREVILEEVAEIDDDPWGRLEMAVHEELFGDHPYGRRILGRETSLAAIQQAELAAFHRLAYAPDRAVLTVAGAVGAEVFAAAEELFGDLAGLGAAPGVDAPQERSGLSRVELARGETRRALLALPSPPATARDFVSLRLALTALCGGRSSRLQRLLVEEGKLCGSVSTAMMETVRPGAATLALELLPGVEPERVEEIVLRELERSRRGLEPGDVERARQLLLSDWLFGHETVRTARTDLGRGAGALWLRLRREPGALARRRDGRGGRGRGSPLPRSRAGRSDRVGRRLKVRARAVAGAPVAALRVWLRAGERHARIPGQALLAGQMLEEGSEARGWRRVARDAEERGISISASAGYELLGLALDGPASETDRMIDWAAELALTPAFDAERWEWQRQLALADLELIRDDPETLAGWGFLAQLYGAHPRSRPLQGDAASLARLTVEDSRASYEQAIGTGTIVAIAGAIDAERATARLREAFAAGARSRHEPLIDPAPPAGGERRRIVALPGDQAHVFIGRPTVGRAHPDLPALELLAVVLGAGAGLAGRLPSRVRERDGLAYTTMVDTAAGASADPGRLVIYAATAPERVERLESAVREELDRLIDCGVSAEELVAARSFLEGQEAFRRETARQWAGLMAEAEHTGLPVDSPDWGAARWASIAATDLREIAERWLAPTGLWVTVGTPAGGPSSSRPRAAS